MKKYTKYTELPACRLTKEDLIKLVDTIKSEFPPSVRENDFEIETRFNDTSIHENTLDAFFGHQNLPDKLSYLNIRMVGWSEKENHTITKSISLTYNTTYGNLVISSDSDIFVKGKFNQIMDFLNKKKPKFNIIVRFKAFLIGVLGATILLEALYILEKFFNHTLRANFLMYASLIGLIIFFSILIKIEHAQIYLNKKNLLEKIKPYVGITSLAIGLAGLIISVIK